MNPEQLNIYDMYVHMKMYSQYELKFIKHGQFPYFPTLNVSHKDFIFSNSSINFCFLRRSTSVSNSNFLFSVSIRESSAFKTSPCNSANASVLLVFGVFTLLLRLAVLVEDAPVK